MAVEDVVLDYSFEGPIQDPSAVVEFRCKGYTLHFGDEEYLQDPAGFRFHNPAPIQTMFEGVAECSLEEVEAYQDAMAEDLRLFGYSK